MTESSRASGSALERARTLAGAALAAEPSGLLTDFDGTLSPVVGDPTLARLVEGVDGVLARLADRLAVVAVVTGRAALDVRSRVGVPRVLVAGNHGVEWLAPNESEPRPVEASNAVTASLERMLATVPAASGIFVERKGLSATVHYRNAGRPARARDEILGALAAAHDPAVDVREGRMSVELRPRGLGDKGAAAREIVARYSLRGVVVMGDDVTDLDMFAAIAELRDAGGLKAALVAVGGADREVPPEVAAAADVTLADPEAAAALLAGLAADLSSVSG